jgi:hypothetical protein
MTDTLSRARAYVATMAPAIAGQHGHSAAFKVATALVHGFGLSEDEAFPLFEEYSARCQPPWSRRELEHKLNSALRTTNLKPSGHLRDTRHERDPDETPAPRPKTRIKLFSDEEAPKEETSVRDEGAQDEQPPIDLEEAHRIAGELVKLHKRGVIKGADDPEAVFMAGMLKMFGGTVVETRADDKPQATGKYTPTDEQLVKVPFGLHGKALRDFLQKDLEDAFA